MFSNVSNQLSGVGSSLGSWFKKKDGEEGAEGNGSKEATDSPQPDQPSPASANVSEKSVKGSADEKEEVTSNHSSATEGADSHPGSDAEADPDAAAAGTDPNKPGFGGLAQFNLSGVSSRASASAKTVGSFFGSAFSKASASVKEAGSKIKETVEKNTLLSEFNKEQEAFIAAKGGKVGAEALPPWVGYPEEEKLKEEITGLATERKNFVRNPPTGVIFEFDLEQFLPVAQATLAADPSLEKMRFELVPKVVSEEVFWRNYFYRVGLVRQSTELSSLEQEGGTADRKPADAADNKGGSSVAAAEGTGKRIATACVGQEEEDTSECSARALPHAAALRSSTAVSPHISSPQQEAAEFVSDSFQPSSEDVEEVKRNVSSITKTTG